MERMQHSPEFGIDLHETPASKCQQLLVVDDEADTVFLLKCVLQIAGFTVFDALNGTEALTKIRDHKPDLVLLDLMMPRMSGWEIYRRLREFSNTPVIIVSASGEDEDVVRGLYNGVDDFITKPFYNAEVVARVQAVLRRSVEPTDTNPIVFPNIHLSVDLSTQEVSINGERVSLTQKEFAILSVLARHAPESVRYEQISEAVWRDGSIDARNRTKYFVYLLRKKLNKILPDYDIIQNLDRHGYRLQTGE